MLETTGPSKDFKYGMAMDSMYGTMSIRVELSWDLLTFLHYVHHPSASRDYLKNILAENWVGPVLFKEYIQFNSAFNIIV